MEIGRRWRKNVPGYGLNCRPDGLHSCARLEKVSAPDPSRARGSPHPRVAPPARFPRGSSDPAPFVREMSAAPRDPRNHWSEAEHAAFLRGLEAHGRGNWAAIARDYVPTRTNQQVYSHASKWFEVQAKRELHDANAESANPHRGARRPGSREEPGDDAFGPSSRTIPIPPRSATSRPQPPPARTAPPTRTASSSPREAPCGASGATRAGTPR